MVVRQTGLSVGVLEFCQQLCKAAGVLQKEPAHHCLKSRGLPIDTRLSFARPPARFVASCAYPLKFFLPQKALLLQAIESMGLGISTDVRNDSPMQIGTSAGLPATAHPLVQLPDGISEPGQLKWTQLAGPSRRLELGQPGGRIRRRWIRGRC